MWRALTPGYAAPEQLTGAPPSTAMDVYGLGALLHRLLTGRTPQASTESTDTTRPSLLVRSADDAYHRHYVPLKNDLDRVLLKALAEEPEQRYATAEALADRSEEHTSELQSLMRISYSVFCLKQQK